MIDEDADDEITLTVRCPDCTLELGELVVRSTDVVEKRQLYRHMRWVAEHTRCSACDRIFRQRR
jgi:transposase